MRSRLLKQLRICSLALVLQMAVWNQPNSCLAASQDPYAVKPWEGGQYVVYQILSFGGDGAENGGQIPATGGEVLKGKPCFGVKINIFESAINYGFNAISKEPRKNISLKALVSPKDTGVFGLGIPACTFVSKLKQAVF